MKPALHNIRRRQAEQRRRLFILTAAFVASIVAAQLAEAAWTDHNAARIAAGS